MRNSKTLPMLLSFSLACLVVALLFLLKEEHQQARPAIPRGTPPSESWKPTPRRTPEPTVAQTPVTAPEESQEPIDESESQYASLNLRVTVVADGEPVVGARTYAAPIRQKSDGERRPADIFAQMVWGTPASGPDGIASVDVSYLTDLPSDTLFEVGAYHPEFGTDYFEYTLEELQTLTPEVLLFELEQGEVITGRVLDTTGGPLSGVEVRVSTMHHFEEVGLSGIGALTDEDGSFRIAGIRFNNTPLSIRGTYRDGGRLEWQRRGRFRLNLDRQLFDESAQEWYLGDIAMSNFETREPRFED